MSDTDSSSDSDNDRSSVSDNDASSQSDTLGKPNTLTFVGHCFLKHTLFNL